MFWLKPTERLDDLQQQGLQIIQSDEVFAFSLDAVLLANYVTVRPRDHVVDLGTGTGVIPLLVSRRNPTGRVVGVEIQERLADMAARSVAGNELGQRVEIVQGDLRDAPEYFPSESFDVVTCNPPYRKIGQGDVHAPEHVRIARHEVTCTLADAVQSAAYLVRSGGKVAFVHRADRLADVIWEMRARRLEPKRLRMVHPRADRHANMLLIEAIKNGGVELRIDPPLIVHREDGSYSEEIQAIYAGEGD